LTAVKAAFGDKPIFLPDRRPPVRAAGTVLIPAWL